VRIMLSFTHKQEFGALGHTCAGMCQNYPAGTTGRFYREAPTVRMAHIRAGWVHP
jgi:hypothetical protein